MIDFLGHVLNEQVPPLLSGENHDFSWQWLDEGVMVFTPNQPYEKVIVLSAGIHGNETAPIELIDQICHDLLTGKLKLKVRLLLILGHPLAIRQGKRYIEHDMNRMFCGGYQQLPQSVETQRVERLEQIVKAFFDESAEGIHRYHYDLHTAIRTSLLPTFALFPHETTVYDDFLDALNAAELDAIVYHNTAGRTFTHYSSAHFHAASVTLELGRAKPFGANDLNQFKAIHQVLRAVISQTVLPKRNKAALRVFNVMESIIKTDDDFQLNLDETAPNFSVFNFGAMIASQKGGNIYAKKEKVHILFPNIHVKKGLRAGLILEEIIRE